MSIFDDIGSLFSGGSGGFDLSSLFGGGASDAAATAASDAGSAATDALTQGVTDAASAAVPDLGTTFGGGNWGDIFNGYGTSTGGVGTAGIEGAGAGLDPSIAAADDAAPGSALAAAPSTAGGVGAPGDNPWDPNQVLNGATGADSTAGAVPAGNDSIAGASTDAAAPGAVTLDSTPLAPLPNSLGLTPDTPSDAPNIGQQAVSALHPLGGPPGAPTSIDNFMSNPGVGTGLKVLGNNANLLLPAGLMGLSAAMQPKTQNPNDIIAQQTQLANAARQQIADLQSGKLPAGTQAQIDIQTQQAQAAIRQRYASLGLSGSPMEQQDLANAARQAQAQGLQTGATMAQTALAGLQIPSGIYQNQLTTAMAQDKALSDSIAKFAASAAGGAYRPTA